jgi:hypothetical protein
VVGSDAGDSSERSSEKNKSISEHVVVGKSMRVSTMMIVDTTPCLGFIYDSSARDYRAYSLGTRIHASRSATHSSFNSVLDQSETLASVTGPSEPEAEDRGGRWGEARSWRVGSVSGMAWYDTWRLGGGAGYCN